MPPLTRARSLHKPTGPTVLHPPNPGRERARDAGHNASPSRLPARSAVAKTACAASTDAAPATSRRLTRPDSASSSASSAAAAAGVVVAAGSRPRQSTLLGNKPATTSLGQNQKQKQPVLVTTTPTPKPTLTPARKERSRYPPSSSTPRPQSMLTRPTSAGSTTTATTNTSTGTRRTTPTHGRAHSAAVTRTSNSSTTPRPTAAQVAQERKGRPRPASQGHIPLGTTAGAGTNTPKRRTISGEKQSAATPTPLLPPPSRTQTTTLQAATATPRLTRPAFSTLQQQRFSPAKINTPKPLSTTCPATPSPAKLSAANTAAASAETSRLQTELMQLHFMHRDAAAVEARWRASAKEKLGVRFRALQEQHGAVAALEAAAAEGENVAALLRWRSAAGVSLGDKVQALDAAVSGVWAMSEPGGKYARVVRRFERWIERVMDLEEARANGTIGLWLGSSGGGGGGGNGGREETLFIRDLDQAWTEECVAMTRKLEGWQAQLDCAGYPAPMMTEGGAAEAAEAGSSSSLEKMLDGSRALLSDMLAELGAMEEIRQTALAREDGWIKAMNRDNDDDDDLDTPRAGAVWRAL